MALTMISDKYNFGMEEKSRGDSTERVTGYSVAVTNITPEWRGME